MEMKREGQGAIAGAAAEKEARMDAGRAEAMKATADEGVREGWVADLARHACSLIKS